MRHRWTMGWKAGCVSCYTPKWMDQFFNVLFTRNGKINGKVVCEWGWSCSQSEFLAYFYLLPLSCLFSLCLLPAANVWYILVSLHINQYERSQRRNRNKIASSSRTQTLIWEILGIFFKTKISTNMFIPISLVTNNLNNRRKNRSKSFTNKCLINF